MFNTGSDHAAWKGQLACDSAKRQRAQGMHKLTKCDKCGEKAHDRHHIDGDPGNNAKENIMLLCRHCHMAIDGRLDMLAAFKKQICPLRKCANCGRLYKPLRKGICSRCNEYFRRHGVHRPDFIEGSTVVTHGMLKLMITARNANTSYDKIGFALGISGYSVRAHIKAHNEKTHQNLS